MKRNVAKAIWAALVCVAVAAPSPAQTNGNSAELSRVLGSMDRAAATFKTAQADFVWDQYSKVVDEHDLQKGIVYYRVAGKHGDREVQMAANIREPSAKYVVFTNGKVQVYQPAIEQVTEYCSGKNKAEFESFLVLGFGGNGRDLEKQFQVSYGGADTVAGVKAEKLLLVPKSPKIHNMFSQIILWIDPSRGISVQQEFLEPSGDYRLAKYSDIKVNQNVPGEVFKLKTSGKTKWVRPQGGC